MSELIRQKLAATKAKEKAGQMADAIVTDLDAVKGNYENTPQPLEQMARRHGAVFQTLKNAEGRALITREELAKLVPTDADLATSVFENHSNLYSPFRADGDQGAIVFQVLEYRDAEVQPYQDVQALVRSDCVQQMAVANAQAFAANLKARADEAGPGGPAGPMVRSAWRPQRPSWPRAWRTSPRRPRARRRRP